jgi:hypothetical protein
VSAAGSVPSLSVETFRGEMTVDDLYVDTYADVYTGSTSPMGTSASPLTPTGD